MGNRPLWKLLVSALTIALLAACGGDSTSPNTLLAAKNTPASLSADDPAWADADTTTIKTVVIEGSGAQQEVDVSVKALYNDTDVFFRVEWADSSESVARLWEYDGSAWTSVGNEDRLALYLEISPIDRFQTRGCGVLCHNPEADPIDSWYMITPAEDDRADNWHWKAARTNPIGQVDDKFLTGILEDPEDIESANKGDAKDSGGYADNLAADGPGPAMMQDPAKEPSAGSSALLASEAVDLDASSMSAGDTVPRELLAEWTGSRGDITAEGVWADGKWTVVFQRKLDTGHDDDVQFTTGRSYPFGLSVFDNAGGVDHTTSSDVLILKFD